MEEVKQFLENLFTLEQEARHLSHIKEKIDEYNEIAMEIKSYMIDVTVGLGVPVARFPKPDFWYEGEFTYPKPRNLFKITEYENPEYGKLWACYVSVANSITDEVKSIANCFIVAKIEDELKMISLFFYDDMDDFMWKLGGGIRLNYYELGKVVEVERLLSPLKDERSLEEYMLDR